MRAGRLVWETPILTRGATTTLPSPTDKLLKVKPDYIPVYQPLAYALVRLDRYSEATDTLKQALDYDRNNAEIHNNLGFAYVHAGRYAEAVAACQKQSSYSAKQVRLTNRSYKLEMKFYPMPIRTSATPITV